jgi:hypothetical protein
VSVNAASGRIYARLVVRRGFRTRIGHKQSSPPFPKSAYGIVTIWPLDTETLKGLKTAELIGLIV